MNLRAANWTDFFSGGVHHVEQIDSTQQFIHALKPNREAVFCRADMQHHGYGQRGRAWQSPQGNLYCSFRVFLSQPPACQSGLAQMLALAIAQVLDPSAKHLHIKWPNDLFTSEGKCGGILVENQPFMTGSLSTIGIGINLTHAADHQGILSRDLSEGYAVVETVLNTIMPAMITELQRWSQQPYLPVAHRWSDYDRYHQQTVSLENHPCPANVLGIDQKGRLMVCDHNGLHFLTQSRIEVIS